MKEFSTAAKVAFVWLAGFTVVNLYIQIFEFGFIEIGGYTYEVFDQGTKIFFISAVVYVALALLPDLFPSKSEDPLKIKDKLK